MVDKNNKGSLIGKLGKAKISSVASLFRSDDSDANLATKILKGMFVVLFFWLFWKFGGFLLTIIIGALYPPNAEEPAADAYSHVYKIIVFTFIYSSTLKILLPAFMPIFVEKMKQKSESEAWEFAYSIINVVLLLAIVGSGVSMFFARDIIDLLVPGFNENTRELCAALFRIMLPGCVGMILSMVLMSILNSYKIFSYSAAGDAAQKLVWAAALFLGARYLGLDALVIGYGFLAGCIVQVLINLFGLRAKLKFYRPTVSSPGISRFARELGIAATFAGAFVIIAFSAESTVSAVFVYLSAGNMPAVLQAFVAPGTGDVGIWTRMVIFTSGLVLTCIFAGMMWLRVRKRSSSAARFAALIAPLMIGVVFARYRDIVTSLFQSYTKAGVFADLEFGKNIGNFPIVLVAYGLSVAMFPYLCDLASGKDLKTFGTLVTRAIRMIALFFIPLSITIILLDKQIFSLIYDRGNWIEPHLNYAATGLSFYVFALFFYAIENVIMQSFFSVQRMWMPTLVGILASLFQVLFLFFAIRYLGYNRPYDIFLIVALVYPLSRILKNMTLLGVLRVHVPILPMKETAAFVAKLAVTCGIFGLSIYGVRQGMNVVAPLQDFKQTDVVVDTFNAENTQWTSRDADTLTVETEENKATLTASYRPLSSREVTLERDLNAYLLNNVTRVLFECRAAPEQQVAVELDFGDHVWRSPPITVDSEWHDEPYAIDVPSNAGRLIQFTLVLPVDPEVTRASQQILGRPDFAPQRLFLRQLCFIDNGRKIVTDSVRQPSVDWQANGQTLLVGNPGGEDSSEKALLLVDENGSKRAVRNLVGYDLQGMSGMSFKLKAEADALLEVQLTDSKGNTFSKEIEVEKSDERKRYAINFGGMTGLDPAELDAVAFYLKNQQGPAQRVWLDNVTFVAPRLFGRLSVTYEAAKFAHVAIPCGIGGIVLISLIFLLRIEEGRLALDWVLKQGKAKLAGGGKSDAEEPVEA